MHCLLQEFVYTVSAWVKTTSGGSTVFLAVQNATSYSSGNTNIQSTTNYHAGDGAWHQISSTFTVPAACQTITIALIKAATTTSVIVSSFQIQSGSTPSAMTNSTHYIPGSDDNFIDRSLILTGAPTPYKRKSGYIILGY